MKRKFQFKSVRTRLTFWFLLVAIVPLIVVSTIIYYQRVEGIKKGRFERLTAIRDLKVKQLNLWLDERIGDARTIAENYEIRGLEGFFDKEEIAEDDKKKLIIATSLLDRYLKNYAAYHEVFIIDPASGKIALSTNRLSEGLDKSEDPYFKEPMRTKDVFIRDIYYSKALREPSMDFSVPIFCSLHEGEHIIGILVARVALKTSLYSLLLDRTGMGKTGETLIVNKDVVALNELRWHEDAPLILRIKAEPAVRAARGESGIVETEDYRGKMVLAAYTHISKTGWGFVSKQDLKEIYAPIREMLWNILLPSLVSILAIYLAAFLVARNIARPVRAMTEVSGKIEGGNLSVRNPVGREDEFGFLAESFNNMADAVMSQMAVQKGSADITEVMMTAAELKDFAEGLVNILIEVTKSHLGAFYLRREDGPKFEHFASIGGNPDLMKPFDAEMGEGAFGKALATKRIAYIQDIPEDSIFIFRTVAGTVLPKEIATIPVVVEGKVVAVVTLASFIKYPKESLEILEDIFTGMGIAFSNLLASEKTSKLAVELETKNQELQAQTEELQSVSEELQNQADELQKQNVELQSQRQQVEEANRLKSEFLSNMSHELRTPLNSVMALSRVLAMQTKDKLTEEETNYLEIIERNGKNLLALINDILDLSKIEAGKIAIAPKLFSIGSTVEVIVESLVPIAGEKGITIEEHIDEGLPQIESDETKVHQILQNVIGNAVKFTEEGSAAVSARSDGVTVQIEVTDTGIGIAESDLPHVFEEFRQADGSTSRQYEGTGLGLTIAYRTAKLLGGNISVESKLGEGSTFTVTLPVKWTGEAEVYEKTGFQQVPETVVAPKTSLIVDDDPETGRRILLVEDNEVAIVQVKKILEKEGYEVDTARGGKEAIDYIAHTIPDGIVLDLMMPEVDGFEVLERMRSTKAMAQIPVLILTAKDLSPVDLKRLSANRIQQLVHKGEVNQQEMLFKIALMLGSRPGAAPDISAEDKKVAAPVGKKEKRPQSRSTGGTPTILVVEDNPDNMTTIKAILGDRYRILESHDGEEGLKMALAELPDLVLLDMALPGMDGFTVVRKIKENKKGCQIPVIALTARSMKGDREKIIEAGCDEYISKPFELEELLSTVKKFVT